MRCHPCCHFKQDIRGLGLNIAPGLQTKEKLPTYWVFIHGQYVCPVQDPMPAACTTSSSGYLWGISNSTSWKLSGSSFPQIVSFLCFVSGRRYNCPSCQIPLNSRSYFFFVFYVQSITKFSCFYLLATFQISLLVFIVNVTSCLNYSNRILVPWFSLCSLNPLLHFMSSCLFKKQI